MSLESDILEAMKQPYLIIKGSTPFLSYNNERWYPSSSVYDKMSWSGAWLYLATGFH